MKDFKEKFYQTLNSRNDAQKEAINAIYGPVLVVAGPGTGKTDVLGLRIGNILQETDTDIQSVLCLTYTEAGAVEMRKRLVEYIGPEAYNASIFTFHGFCNMVIHENLRHFNVYLESQPVSDLEKFQILKEILDSLPMDHILRRNSGKRYYESSRLSQLFETMKKEGWDPGFMYERIDKWIEEERMNEVFYYKRATTRGGKRYEAGDFKDWQFEKDVVAHMQLLRPAVELFDVYNEHLQSRNRYDYQDMLTWVRDAFKADEGLLAQYQERYQFFLVDEFQDTNGIQLELLKLLVRPWMGHGEDRPDVFVVGDDDQSIFRFQGAMMENIIEFKDEYDPRVVVLTENYRSTQNILDAATTVIENNQDRLVARFPRYSKDLIARASHAGSTIFPEIRIFPNNTLEDIHLVVELTKLHEEGALGNESVAVIYRKHRQVANIVRVLENRRIPLNVKRPVNILHEPLVRHILLVFEYLLREYQEIDSGEYILFQLLHLQYFGINIRDAGLLALECRYNRHGEKVAWRDVMSDEDRMIKAGIRDTAGIVAFHELLSQWQAGFSQYTIPALLQEVLTNGGILNWIFREHNRGWLLQVMRSFFEYINREVARNPDMSVERLLHDVELMNEYNIDLPVSKVLSEKNGIHFITAHSAKGMEFDRVYMLGCTRDIWEQKKGGGHGYKLPGVSSSISDGGEEEERRLFYVGMTRARLQLLMSYHLLKENDRETEASRFIEECRLAQHVRNVEPEVGEDDLVQTFIDEMTVVREVAPVIDNALIDRVLENFVMSASALNAYLECPRKFYFDFILKVPSAPRAHFAFGQAVHGALEEFLLNHVDQNQLKGDESDLVTYFNQYMDRKRAVFTSEDFLSYKYHGAEILKSYFTDRKDEWIQPVKVLVERNVEIGHHRGVPIKGILDRVDFFKDHVVITDYKTGNSSYAGAKLKRPKDDDPGGNYWRQMVFYKFLADTDTAIDRPMSHAQIDFIDPDKSGEHVRKKVTVAPEDEQLVSDQLVTVYAAISNHEFTTGCDQPDCFWCNFVHNHLQLAGGMSLPEAGNDFE